MTLDPAIARILKFTAALPRLSEVPVPAARKGFLARIAQLPPAPDALESVQDLQIALEQPARALPMRLYRPLTPDPCPPLLLYLHGGGFVLGNLDSHDGLCRRLCARSAHAVLAVDYRLAPEHPWPAAHEDAWAALRWATNHAASLGLGAGNGIAVAGDSAGGALAAGLALRSRDQNGPVGAQVLLYPVLDYPQSGHASYREFAEGFGLTRDAMDFFAAQYFADAAHADAPYALPLRTGDLSNLPPALIITAWYDVLRDEAEAYARALAAAGVAVEERRYAGMNHGFMGLAGMVRAADEAIEQVCTWLLSHQHRMHAARHQETPTRTAPDGLPA